MVCSQVVDYIQKQQSLKPAYFFCSYSLTAPDTCLAVIRTVAAQLIGSHPDLITYIYRSYVENVRSTSIKRMKDLLREILSSLSGCRIVLDGIDECATDQQKEIISTFLSLQDGAGDSCKVLFSSRNDESHIKRLLSRKIGVQMRGHTDDAIALYVNQKVGDLSSSFDGLDQVLLDKVRQRMCSQAQGAPEIPCKPLMASLMVRYRYVLMGSTCIL